MRLLSAKSTLINRKPQNGVYNYSCSKRRPSVSFRCSSVITDHRLLNSKHHNLFPGRAVARRWKEYQGIANWDGLLDPLDDNLRSEILRYGGFVDAAYKSFDFEPSSPTFATCRYPKSSLLDRCGLAETGYRITKNLRATSGIELPRWMERAPSWVARRSSWIGYVAVCEDRDRIAKLGRRDVVISFRGTATGLEWLENLRATLAPLLPGGPMVETGFLSLYTSRNIVKGQAQASLQDMVRDEVSRILRCYGGEALSLTMTGHSLGAALATLAAYDISTWLPGAPMVTVMSFGGPRVGNRSFSRQLDRQGTKVLRIVNSDDVITKMPGLFVAGTEWEYAEVGRELRLSSSAQYFRGLNLATCHDLKTYLELVNGFHSSTCPIRATAKRILRNHPNSSATAFRV